MRVFIVGREYPDNLPEGFRTFKCAALGCRKMATMQVRDPCLKHLHAGQDTRCFCLSHGMGVVDQTVEQTGCDWYEPIIEMASTGYHLMRRRQDAYGGWKGWEYAVILTPESAAERDCPNPLALRDNDGNWLIE